MTTKLCETNIENFFIHAAQRNNHGGYFWPIHASKESKLHPRIQVTSDSEPLRIPFGASSYNDSGRLSLNFNVENEDIVAFFRKLDAHIIEHVWKNKEDFFKKPPATVEILREMYVPTMSQKQDFQPLLKTKLNGSCLVFLVGDSGTKKGSVSDIEAGCHAVPVVQVDKIWTMSGRFGCTLVTCALMLWPRREKQPDDVFLDLALNCTENKIA